MAVAGRLISRAHWGNLRNVHSVNLDLLRAYAVGLVLAAHLLPHMGLHGSSLGFFGVMLFFVHTSLVLMQSLERQGESGLTMFGHFYLRRAFRIYPLSILTVISASLLGMARLSGTDLALNLALVMNLRPGTIIAITPLWSLPYEVQMYLLLPALFIFARRATWKAFMALLVAVAGLAAVAPPALDIFSYFGCFYGGILAYRLMSWPARRVILPAWILPALLVVMTAGFVLSRRSAWVPLRWTLCLILGAALPHVRAMRIGSLSRAAKTIATYSYGIYLGHWFGIEIAFVRLSRLPNVAQWAIFGVFIVTIPYLSYRLIEEPLIQVGKRIIARRGLHQNLIMALESQDNFPGDGAATRKAAGSPGQ